MKSFTTSRLSNASCPQKKHRIDSARNIMPRSCLLLSVIVSLASLMACKNDPEAPFHMTGLGGKGGHDADGGSGSGAFMEEVGGAAGAPVWEPEDSVCDGFLCAINQVCVAVDEFATCQCLSGFAGPDCTDINECSNPDRCGSGGKCQNYQGTFSCECGAGTSRGADGCVDTNECSSGTSACDDDATCANFPGDHICTCDPGLFGDGTFCKNVDSCAGSPCGDGECHNTASGFSCECEAGRSGSHCEGVCSLDAEIAFGSSILEAAVRNVVAVSGSITPRMLAEFSELFVAPPDTQLGTNDEIKTLDGLQCWPTLRVLDLRGHGVTDIDAIASLGALETLNLTCNRATDLSPIQSLSQLRDLNLSKGSLCTDNERLETDFEFLRNLTNLRHLDASFYSLANDVDALSRLRRLKSLNLRGNELSNMDGLSDLVQLEELNLAQNPLTDVEALSNLTLLKRLNLALTGVSDTGPVNQLKRLEELDLSANLLTNLNGIEFNSELRILRLSDNFLSEVAVLEFLEHLLVLDVSGNRLTSVAPLLANAGFSGGQLWLGDNPFNCVAGAAELEGLKHRGVQVFGVCSP